MTEINTRTPQKNAGQMRVAYYLRIKNKDHSIKKTNFAVKLKTKIYDYETAFLYFFMRLPRLFRGDVAVRSLFMEQGKDGCRGSFAHCGRGSRDCGNDTTGMGLAPCIVRILGVTARGCVKIK